MGGVCRRCDIPSRVGCCAVDEALLSHHDGMRETEKVVALYLEIACKVFIQHIPGTLPLHDFNGDPPFHEVWLKLLQTLQPLLIHRREHLVEAAAALGPGPKDSSRAAPDTAPPTATTAHVLPRIALEYVKCTLLAMAALGIFTPGQKTIGRELWEFTWTLLEGFPMCDGVCSALFPGCDFGSPPSSKHVANIGRDASVEYVVGPYAALLPASITALWKFNQYKRDLEVGVRWCVRFGGWPGRMGVTQQQPDHVSVVCLCNVLC